MARRLMNGKEAMRLAWLRQAMLHSVVTETELAAVSGMSVAQVYWLLAGKVALTPQRFQSLVPASDVDVPPELLVD